MKHRTALVAAFSVAGVLAAGATAIAANLGILDSTNSGFGQLSAVASTSTTPDGSGPQVVTVYVDDTSIPGVTPQEPSTTTAPTTTLAPAPGPELLPYAVEGAGVVTLARDGDVLTVAGVDAPGWAWSVAHDGDQVQLALRSGTRVLSFTAQFVSGEVQVTVDEAVPSTATIGRGEDDDHHGDDHGGSEDDD